MRYIIQFIVKHQFFLLFLLLETIALTLVIRFNYYHQITYLNFAQEWHANISLKKERIKQYLLLKKLNERLLAENELLKNELERYKSIVAEAREKALSDTSANGYIAARVINNSVVFPYNYITINKGTKNGINPDMPVLCDKGIVGTIVATSDNYSIVMPLINKKFKVSAKFKKNNYFGSLEWDGNNYRIGLLNDIPLHVKIEIGDTIVTSGFSNIFPENVLIGTVKNYSVAMGTFYSVEVLLTTDFKNLYYVYVLKDKNKYERIKLEKIIINE